MVTRNVLADPVEVDPREVRRLLRSAIGQLGETEVLALVEDARALAAGREFVSMGGRERLPLIDLRRWAQSDPPDRQSFWGDGWLPHKQTTMLTGRGGIGKSLFTQCLLVCTALGREFLGMPTTQANSLYITCEDDADELWRRMKAICDVLGVGIEDLAGKLHLVSLCGSTDTALATFDAAGQIEPTSRWADLVGTVETHGIRVVAFDNATDAMAGDLNDLHQVAEFVNLTTGLAIRMDGPFLILHHPNKAGDDWLGSVAWHNKVRSRLIIEDGGIDGDPDARAIRNPKANYGPQGGRVAFRWYEGAFIGDAELSAEARERLESTARAAADNQIFLRCLRLLTKQERAVSASPSNTYAPATFARLNDSKGIGKARLEAAMERLLSIGAIEKGELPWKKPDRHQAIGLRETAADGAVNPAVDGAADVRQTPPNTAQNHAGDAARSHPSYYVREGAAPDGPAAPYDDDTAGCW